MSNHEHAERIRAGAYRVETARGRVYIFRAGADGVHARTGVYPPAGRPWYVLTDNASTPARYERTLTAAYEWTMLAYGTPRPDADQVETADGLPVPPGAVWNADGYRLDIDLTAYPDALYSARLWSALRDYRAVQAALRERGDNIARPDLFITALVRLDTLTAPPGVSLTGERVVRVRLDSIAERTGSLYGAAGIGGYEVDVYPAAYAAVWNADAPRVYCLVHTSGGTTWTGGTYYTRNAGRRALINYAVSLAADAPYEQSARDVLAAIAGAPHLTGAYEIARAYLDASAAGTRLVSANLASDDRDVPALAELGAAAHSAYERALAYQADLGHARRPRLRASV